MSSPCWAATSRIRSCGPTRIGSISFSLAAFTTLSSDTWSQGCATATLTGGCFWAVAISFWNFSCVLRLTGASASSTDIVILLLAGPGRLCAKQPFDFRKPPLGFAGRLARRGYDALDRAQRLCALVGVARDQLWDCSDRTFLVDLQEQILFAHRFLQLIHRSWPAGRLR